MAGGVASERTAKRWDGFTCPHCGVAEETAEHRFWERGAWDGVRAKTAPGLVAPDLRRRLNDGVARTG
eukprot:6737878-Lingulodinium_polyedra.AAC.1